MRVTSLVNNLGPEFVHSIVPLNGSALAQSRLLPCSQARVVNNADNRGGWAAPFRLGSILRKLRPDLLLTYNWGAMDAVLAARVGRICPVIHNECGFGAEEAGGLKRRRVLMRRLLLNTLPLTIVVSRTLEQLALKSFRIQRKRVRFIQTGVDTQRFCPRRNGELRQQLNIPKNRIVFGYVGGLRPEKNLPLLIGAFAKAEIADSHLLLLGEGALRPELQAMAEQLGIAARVSFVGAVQDTAPHYNAMDVFVMSSATEQTPNALLEAMASGLPAVCTDVGDTFHMLGSSSRDLIAPSGNSDAYVRALKEIAGSKELRMALGDANRKRCVSVYSRERMVQEYREAYLSVLER